MGSESDDAFDRLLRDVAAAPALVVGAWLIGRRLGRYEVREELGRGGFGVVCRAWDAALQRDVALKVFSTDEDWGSVEQEAQTLATLEHARVASVYDVGVDDGLSYVAMQLLAGGTFDDAVQADVDVERLLQDVLEGLSALHSRGVVHRDLKPSNVLLDDDGRAVLVDFGLAFVGEASALAPAGTPGWVAPEVLQGAAPSTSSDVFAFGKLLEMAAKHHALPPRWQQAQAACLSTQQERPTTAMEVQRLLSMTSVTSSATRTPMRWAPWLVLIALLVAVVAWRLPASTSSTTVEVPQAFDDVRQQRMFQAAVLAWWNADERSAARLLDELVVDERAPWQALALRLTTLPFEVPHATRTRLLATLEAHGGKASSLAAHIRRRMRSLDAASSSPTNVAVAFTSTNSFERVLGALWAPSSSRAAALAALQDVWANDKSAAVVALHLSYAHQRQGTPDAAMQILEDALRALPGHPQLELQLARLQASTTSPRAALAALRPLLPLHPADAKLRFDVAEALAAAGDDEGHAKQLSALLHDPFSPALGGRGVLLHASAMASKGEVQASRAWTTQALQRLADHDEWDGHAAGVDRLVKDVVLVDARDHLDDVDRIVQTALATSKATGAWREVLEVDALLLQMWRTLQADASDDAARCRPCVALARRTAGRDDASWTPQRLRALVLLRWHLARPTVDVDSVETLLQTFTGHDWAPVLQAEVAWRTGDSQKALQLAGDVVKTAESCAAEQVFFRQRCRVRVAWAASVTTLAGGDGRAALQTVWPNADAATGPRRRLSAADAPLPTPPPHRP